jgi:hypothetical protein
LAETNREDFMANHRAFWSRVFTYIPTPTTGDGETVDLQALCQVIDHQIEHGANRPLYTAHLSDLDSDDRVVAERGYRPARAP